MNFADAIRKASKESDHGYLAIAPEPFPLAEVRRQQVAVQVVAEPTPVVAEPVVDVKPVASKEPVSAAPAAPMKTVRLELTLTTEEVSLLFRAIATSQHSVLTSREAANHLRLPVQTMEDMAKAGEIPAFQIDGKWRFPKAGLDGWVAVNSATKEAS